MPHHRNHECCGSVLTDLLDAGCTAKTSGKAPKPPPPRSQQQRQRESSLNSACRLASSAAWPPSAQKMPTPPLAAAFC
jgi:hypothetical protein